MTKQLRNIILIGPMGSGKTSTGRVLAKEINHIFLDTDEEVTRRTGVSIAYIFDIEKESGFREREYQALKSLMENRIQLLLQEEVS